MINYVLITESALDASLISEGFSDENFLPNEGKVVHRSELPGGIAGYRVASEPENAYFALIRQSCLQELKETGAHPSDAYRRIARVVKGLKSPPVHLPRQWAEYHHKNFLAFFALSRDTSNMRWVAELGGKLNCARFDFLSSASSEVDLANFVALEWPQGLDTALTALISQEITIDNKNSDTALAEKVDLEAIGSASVVSGRTYEEWEHFLTPTQRPIIETPIESSIRIVGPAGSGKTLSLCMRAIQISRNPEVAAQGKKILIATHSWAMAERIDGILNTLNGGVFPEGMAVFPLLSLLEMHAGNIGQRRTEVIGDDSSDGRLKSLEIIRNILSSTARVKLSGVSEWISEAMRSDEGSRARLDLVVNLYDEISGVLTASGVALDDHESIQVYINSEREDWMPPFSKASDRGFVLSVYREFIQELIDRSAITTDQFILDSIRVLETFTWRMRKETEGYDYIMVDELQLFDPQERSSLELLGRSKTGVPFVTAEDPSQGVFGALNARPGAIQNEPVYLDTVHRFNKGIFELIAFIYQKFPLNTIPLRIEGSRAHGRGQPKFFTYRDDATALTKAAELTKEIFDRVPSTERICLATLGDVDAELVDKLKAHKLQVTRLTSFDDVEQLAYSKRSLVVAPWQFIGGTQFSHVVVVAAALNSPSSQFGRLRELISVYLSCSRAAESLTLVCSNYIPAVIGEANDQGLLSREAYSS